MQPTIKIIPLENHGDQRGDSFPLPEDLFDFLENVNEVHMADIAPGAVRGNHYHNHKKEVLIIWFADNWTFAFSPAENAPPDIKEFTGRGMMFIEIEPQTAHAIKNTGRDILKIAAFSDQKNDPQNPDTLRKEIL